MVKSDSHDAVTASIRFHHGLYEVHLPVTDLDRAIDFYAGKLGFAATEYTSQFSKTSGNSHIHRFR